MEKTEIFQYHELILKTMSEALILINPDGTIAMVNPSFERMFGYSAEEVVGKPCTILNCDVCKTELNHDKNGSWCSLFKNYSPEKDFSARCLAIKKDGTYLPVLKNASLMKNDKGEPLGAVEVLTDISEIERLDRKVDVLSRRLEEEDDFCGIIGKSRVMQNLFDLIPKAAQSEAPVIICGESGTGKELVAQAIHQLGMRREKPFVQFNCAALNESLLESELFGHIKGAFTGAYRHRVGRFEAAHGGDIFLDEIGDLPLAVQVKLLRVLELKQIEHVGDHRQIPVDVRLITATNKNLQDLVAQGLFREDFFFRINVIPIHVPPLRERTEDIPLLVDSFMHRLRLKTEKNITGMSHDCMSRLMDYHWPGNIRELKSMLEFAFVVKKEGKIEKYDLPPEILKPGQAPTESPPIVCSDDPFEKTALIQVLDQCGGNQTKAAAILGVTRVTVWKRMKKYGIDLNKVVSRSISFS